MRKHIHTDLAPPPIGPYSQAVLVGDTLYVSGQIALVPGGDHLLAETIEQETHQVLKNMGAILQEAGGGYESVVKCSIFVKDMGNFVSINAVYAEYFQNYPPARELIEVSDLPKHVNVEISCIAVL